MPMVKTVSYQKMGCLHPKQKLNPIFYKEFEMDRNEQKFHHDIPLKVNQQFKALVPALEREV